MHIGIRSQTQEINAKIIEDFYEGPLSVAALVTRYGKSPSTINKLLAQYKIQYLAEHGDDRPRNGKPIDPRRLEQKKPLSFRHFSIGLAVSRYVTENTLTPTSFGMLVDMSSAKVGNVMTGAYDLTLVEVERLGKVLGIPFNEMVNDRKGQPLAA